MKAIWDNGVQLGVGSIRETGIIQRVEDDQAVIAFRRSDACAKCGMCRGSADGGEEMLITLPNDIGAAPGEPVEVEMPPGRLLGASLAAYAVPLAAIIAGLLIGELLKNTLGITENGELFSAVCGILLMVASFIFVRRVDRRAAKRGMGMRMTRVR